MENGRGDESASVLSGAGGLKQAGGVKIRDAEKARPGEKGKGDDGSERQNNNRSEHAEIISSSFSRH